MPVITEAVVIKTKKPGDLPGINVSSEPPSAWDEYINQATKNKYKVYLVVSGFDKREDASAFAQNFMTHGSLFMFDNKKRFIHRLNVAEEMA